MKVFEYMQTYPNEENIKELRKMLDRDELSYHLTDYGLIVLKKHNNEVKELVEDEKLSMGN